MHLSDALTVSHRALCPQLTDQELPAQRCPLIREITTVSLQASESMMGKDSFRLSCLGKGAVLPPMKPLAVAACPAL